VTNLKRLRRLRQKPAGGRREEQHGLAVQRRRQQAPVRIADGLLPVVEIAREVDGRGRGIDLGMMGKLQEEEDFSEPVDENSRFRSRKYGRERAPAS